MVDNTPLQGPQRQRPSLPTGASAYATPGAHFMPPDEAENVFDEFVTQLADIDSLVKSHTNRLDRHRLHLQNLEAAQRLHSTQIQEVTTLTHPFEDFQALCRKLDNTVTQLTNQLFSQSADLSNAQADIIILKETVQQQAASLEACLIIREDLELELAHVQAQFRDNPGPIGNGGGYRPRPNLPDKFDGTPAKFNGFLLQCNRVFQLFPGAFPTGLTQVGLITSLLTDAALTWVSPLLKSGDPILQDLDLFSTAFTAAFADTDKIERDTRRLDSLTMTTTVQDYVRKFRELSADLGYNDVALRGRFVGGLPDTINDLLLSMPPPATFDVLVSQALTIGGRLAARQEARTENRRQQLNRFPRPQQADAPPNGAPRGPLTDVERLRRRRENLCMFCASPAHTVRECPRVGQRHPQAPRPAPNQPQARVRVLAIQDVDDIPPQQPGNGLPQAL